jgi:lipoprotein-anchoring transpeptidase ErfK/SrfK
LIRAVQRRVRLLAVPALLAALVAPPAAGAATGEPPAPPEGTGAAPAPRERTAAPFRLTTFGGLARWAPVLRPAVVRARPNGSARRVTTLRLRTPEATTNLLLVLERVEARDGSLWVRVLLPILPNESTGWVPRAALGAYETVDTHLVVDRRRLRATLFRRGRAVFRAPVGIGQRRWPTPAGRFYVRNRLSGYVAPLYGPIAFGTSARSAVLTDWPAGGHIGIHGTDRPDLIPGRISHGCVRLRNADIRRLDRLMPVGTPITIR